MNAQLLEEIEELKKREISDGDIASMLGISKANLLLMIRIKRVVEEHQKEQIEKLTKENSTLKLELQEIKKNLPKIENIEQIIEQNGQIPILQERIEDLKERLEYIKQRNDYLEAKFAYVPTFIKKIFCE